MAEEKETLEEAEKEGQPKKPFPRTIIMVVLVLVLGAGGFFGWRLFMKGNQEETEPTKSKTRIEKTEMSIICPLDSFIVNLMDQAGMGKRYLKVKMELEVGSEENKMTVEKSMPKLRDTILLLLSSMSFEEINTMEGKIALKQALLSRVNQILSKGVVRRIYFSEFVVQ